MEKTIDNRAGVAIEKETDHRDTFAVGRRRASGSSGEQFRQLNKSQKPSAEEHLRG